MMNKETKTMAISITLVSVLVVSALMVGYFLYFEPSAYSDSGLEVAALPLPGDTETNGESSLKNRIPPSELEKMLPLSADQVSSGMNSAVLNQADDAVPEANISPADDGSKDIFGDGFSFVTEASAETLGPDQTNHDQSFNVVDANSEPLIPAPAPQIAANEIIDDEAQMDLEQAPQQTQKLECDKQLDDAVLVANVISVKENDLSREEQITYLDEQPDDILEPKANDTAASTGDSFDERIAASGAKSDLSIVVQEIHADGPPAKDSEIIPKVISDTVLLADLAFDLHQVKAADDIEPAIGKPKKVSGGGVWAVNVLSTLDKDKMDETIKELMMEPHQVYSYQTEVKGKNWYRIRIGFFDSKDEANRIGRLLAQLHKLPDPWIVQPGPQELAKYNTAD